MIVTNMSPLHTHSVQPLAFRKSSHKLNGLGSSSSSNSNNSRRSSFHHTLIRATQDELGEGSSSAGQLPNLADPSETIVWGGTLPSSRRAAVGGLTAAGIALGGNLGGLTSWLLGLDGGRLAGQLHADVLIPVLGLKRCVDAANGYEFQYPGSWLADQTLLYRAAQRAEAARSLDLPAPSRPRRRQVVEPSAAFGPAGSTGEENISVIVAPIFEGFRLESLGTPQAAGQSFLDTIAAPPGSDKTAELVAAASRQDEHGTLYYQIEFTIAAPTFKRHNVAVLTSQNNLLYTLTAQCPESKWQQDGAQLQTSAASFRLIPSKQSSYPGSLR